MVNNLPQNHQKDRTSQFQGNKRSNKISNKGYQKRTFYQIRKDIVDFLGDFPSNAYQIYTHLKLARLSALRHLKYLEQMERVEKLVVDGRTFWRLKK